MLWQLAYAPLSSKSIYVDGTFIHLAEAFKTKYNPKHRAAKGANSNRSIISVNSTNWS